MTKPTVERFSYTASVPISLPIIRSTLKKVRDQLLAHDINGGPQKFKMDVVCETGRCGTAACIGGWASIFLLGFEGGVDLQERDIVSKLFDTMLSIAARETHTSRLYNLFYEFGVTKDYNQPNVAATAINRYLGGAEPWPEGKMPRVLPYTRRTYKPAKSK